MRDPGAPVDLYRLLAAADEPELIDREIPDDAEILELGAGSGRITHPLIALGRRVVAVDFNPEMLELIEGAETVLARIEDLELGRTFGGVLLMSTLIDAPGNWHIRIDGRYVVSDDEMLADLAATGLRLLRWIDERHRWLAAALL